jgi:exosome complex component RRP45
LTLQHLPLSVTFAILNSGRSIIVDPTLLEEALADGTLTIVMNHLGELCYLAKTGNVLLDTLTLMNCVRLAKTHVETLGTQVRQACSSTKIRKVR